MISTRFMSILLASALDPIIIKARGMARYRLTGIEDTDEE
jgi:hypothetical protein